jgi:hypothetical protein
MDAQADQGGDPEQRRPGISSRHLHRLQLADELPFRLLLEVAIPDVSTSRTFVIFAIRVQFVSVHNVSRLGTW